MGLPSELQKVFPVWLEGEYRQQILVAADAEVQALIYDNSSHGGVVRCDTNEPFVRPVLRSWTYIVQVGERTVSGDLVAFALTASSLTM